jgi:hypothetical protein
MPSMKGNLCLPESSSRIVVDSQWYEMRVGECGVDRKRGTKLRYACEGLTIGDTLLSTILISFDTSDPHRHHEGCCLTYC